LKRMKGFDLHKPAVSMVIGIVILALFLLFKEGRADDRQPHTGHMNTGPTETGQADPNPANVPEAPSRGIYFSHPAGLYTEPHILHLGRQQPDPPRLLSVFRPPFHNGPNPGAQRAFRHPGGKNRLLCRVYHRGVYASRGTGLQGHRDKGAGL
jgi:hypothetical protein